MLTINALRLTNTGRRVALVCAALAAALTLLSAVTTLDARAAFWDNTNVSFRNSYGKTVSVAILRDSEICGGWAKKGWYELAPGEVKKVFSTTARYAYYYAEAV